MNLIQMKVFVMIMNPMKMSLNQMGLQTLKNASMMEMNVGKDNVLNFMLVKICMVKINKVKMS